MALAQKGHVRFSKGKFKMDTWQAEPPSPFWDQEANHPNTGVCQMLVSTKAWMKLKKDKSHAEAIYVNLL